LWARAPPGLERVKGIEPSYSAWKTEDSGFPAVDRDFLEYQAFETEVSLDTARRCLTNKLEFRLKINLRMVL
jgi:hypothetical protein